MKFTHYTALTALLALSLTACSNVEVEKAETNPLPYDMSEGEGLFSGKSGNILDAFGGDDKEKVAGAPSIGVNGYLWRSAIETISFMPIVSTDSAGGTILTDWFNSPDNANERVKVNVYILGTTLRPQNLKVSVFRQVRTDAGWISAGVSQDTGAQLEETILTAARKLKIKEQASN